VPPIILTPGEPAGIAPEITFKAWAALRHSGLCFALIGDGTQYAARAKDAGIAGVFKSIASLDEASRMFDSALPVLNSPLAAASKAGVLDGRNAGPVIAAIEKAVELCLSGQAAAVVTNPIQKETLYSAGFRFQGHTDFLGHLARQHGHDAHDVMMLVAGGLRAVPVTVHIPLADVPKRLTAQGIIAQARVVNHDLKRFFGIASPRIAVTGLNPHAGENGTMGREDIEIIMPAIEQLRAEGLIVSGPMPADTAFHAEARAGYDAILCMYHDQALIPAKTLDFHGGVNVTLGLPFIRVSPDHGTALNIAGKGTANPASLIAALKLAAQMATHRT
jgi:4-hydroxythreonine-4-phosphate dehydrogenase